MNVNDYQGFALRTAPDVKENADLDLAVLALGVAGEAGEVADIIKKHVGHKHPLSREDVCKEVGDVLWYCAVISSRIGFSLEDVCKANVEKLRKRYPDGFLPEMSMNRRD